MSYRIPKTLDNPIRALGVPIDLWLVFIIICGIFILFDRGLFGIAFGFIAAGVYGRFRTRAVVRKIARYIYWYLPSEFNFITGIKGHQRQMCMRFYNAKIKK